MQEYRVGIVGLGLGKQRAGGYADNPRARIAAVCDTDADRLRAFVTEHEGVRPYDDYETMLDAEALDIVNVSTPDWMHLDHASMALRQGRHVLLEKPMVRSLQEADTLIREVEESGRTLMVGQNYRRIPMSVLAKRLVEEGALGDLFYAASETFQHKRRQFARSPWYASAEHPRAALLGTGIHAVDLLRWLLGEVEEASAYGNHIAYPEFPGDDFTMVQYRFANGVVGRVGVAYGSVLPRGEGGMTLQLYGSRGSLMNERYYVGEPGQGEWRQEELPPVRNPFWQEVDYFLECLDAGVTPAVDVREGARNVAACLAGVEAAATGRPVTPKRY